jgi:hypothetical protein
VVRFWARGVLLHWCLIDALTGGGGGGAPSGVAQRRSNMAAANFKVPALPKKSKAPYHCSKCGPCSVKHNAYGHDANVKLLCSTSQFVHFSFARRSVVVAFACAGSELVSSESFSIFLIATAVVQSCVDGDVQPVRVPVPGAGSVRHA